MVHPACALRCAGGRLFSCRQTEVNAALAILKHVVRTPGERTGCGSGQPPPSPFKSPPCRWFRGESTPNLGGNRFRERYFSFALLSAVRSPSAPQSSESETQRGSRANQSGRTIYVARPVNPRHRGSRAIKLPI